MSLKSLFVKNTRNLISSPPKFDILRKFIYKKDVKILDVGCGNHSSSVTKYYLPKCKYYGIDKIRNYGNEFEDYKLMEKFWQVNLDQSDLKEIPNNFFDIIIFSHVIEHLYFGLEVISRLTKKLTSNGIFYIETPSPHTKYLPALIKKLIVFNFYDDKTHIKIYNKNDIKKILAKEGFMIKRARIYLKLKKIIFSPFLLLASLIKGKIEEFNSILWILSGWSTIVLAIKN